MSQKDRVRNYLDEHKSITSLEAFKKMGVTRLSAVIFNLRRDGLPIMSTTEMSVNKYGEKVRYARYYVNETN